MTSSASRASDSAVKPWTSAKSTVTGRRRPSSVVPSWARRAAIVASTTSSGRVPRSCSWAAIARRSWSGSAMGRTILARDGRADRLPRWPDPPYGAPSRPRSASTGSGAGEHAARGVDDVVARGRRTTLQLPEGAGECGLPAGIEGRRRWPERARLRGVPLAEAVERDAEELRDRGRRRVEPLRGDVRDRDAVLADPAVGARATRGDRGAAQQVGGRDLAHHRCGGVCGDAGLGIVEDAAQQRGQDHRGAAPGTSQRSRTAYGSSSAPCTRASIAPRPISSDTVCPPRA